MKRPEIVDFSHVGRGDVALVGGKGANLGEMTQAGLPVPPGFIVTAAAYERFMQRSGLVVKIKRLLAKLDPEDSKVLHAKARAIQDLILGTDLPHDLIEEIKQSYARLLSHGTLAVAVRSSATAEDLPDASFAGQQATFLNVMGETAVVRAVRAAWASLFEARAIYYRAVHHYDHFKVQIAVPVQVLIQSKKSGVMFTVDPQNGDQSRLVIEAAFGLGEAVVSGAITPDHYVVGKAPLKVLEKKIEPQSWQIVGVGRGKTGGTRHQAIPAAEGRRQKLTDREILELAELGLRVEAHYNFPQDIEWGIDSEGKIWLLQTRPVTTLNKEQETENQVQSVSGAGSLVAGEAPILLKGLGTSVGAASGPVRIIHRPSQIDEIKKGDVLVTEMTDPSFVPAMRRAAAIVTDTGGMTSHAAIVSRELGIPCVVGTGTATHTLKNGLVVTVDGRSGAVYKGKVAINSVPGIQPSVSSPDEAPITATKIYMNLAEPHRAAELAKLPADGVGLLRAEFMIAGIGTHPRYLVRERKEHLFVGKLADGIRTIAAAFAPRPVIYRATDFKTNEYRRLVGGAKVEPNEENPMIGYRGAMRYLREPDLFDLELKALKTVRESYDLPNVSLMIPFVRTTDELTAIRDIVKAAGFFRDPDFKFWMMVEVPSNVIQLDEFLDVGVDGVSIGSNDLTQLILGVDRDNAKLATTFDERHPAVLAAMEHVVATCRRRRVAVSICGQAPSVYPEVTEALVRAGITSVSVNPDAVGSTRRLVASIERRILLDGLSRGVHDDPRLRQLVKAVRG